MCVPNVKELKYKILREAHGSSYSIHLGGNKMYANCPKRKNLDSSPNKYDYAKQNNYNKGDDKKKYRFGDKKKKKF
jgi:hypothetical protein